MKNRATISATAACLFAALMLPTSAPAKVDLVTLPASDRTQITIYNSADLTLARDTRSITMRKGANRLQFAWSGTLIDPTSLELIPLGKAGKANVLDIEYPPRVQGLGIWNIDAAETGEMPFEISYFTSGISWRAYYLATLTPDESALRLDGFVRVDNASGEDFDDVETRLVVGQINLLDRIAELARRDAPYGRPTAVGEGRADMAMPMAAAAPEFYKSEVRMAKKAMTIPRPKEIVKEGLSEYFLYTIEGTESIANGWGKRLPSFSAETVPVRNLFRYDEERYGARPVRFVSFVNDDRHRLGKEPIPGGLVKVFRRADPAAGDLSYVGAQETKYVPKGGDVDLNLGPSDLVSAEFVPMDLETSNYDWYSESITGWDETWTVRAKVANFRDVPARMELRRSFPVTAWELVNEGDFGAYEKVDADTVQYVIDLPANTRREFTYRVTLHKGSRGQR
jgi:hypothetical protein